jgi:hypothetical protein
MVEGARREDDRDDEPMFSEEPVRRPRWWGMAGAGAVAAFVAAVVLSTGSSSVPVGASDSMDGMSMPMGNGRLAVTMRDVDGETVRLPGGQPGVVVFADARNCGLCVAAARAASDALRRTVRAQLTVVMADSTTSREDVAAFSRGVGRSPARYVVDDRNASLASMFGDMLLGGAIVYDAHGEVVARPDARSDLLTRALRRARG